MLRVLIKAGLPLELLIPQINVKVERRLLKYNGDYVKHVEASKVQKFLDKLNPAEATARDEIYYATAAFNAVQYKKKDKLTLVDVYERAGEMWKGQPTTQQARLAKREELDPRWERYKKERKNKAFASWWARKFKRGSF